jgi:U3 small nucleolar RNA-associated protein 6
MAGASDKARFYLEQQVPELREWERREIFTKPEITAIASKRSDFEHILNARGSTPSDYARYAEYEMNLDTLRKKRVKRKGVKTTAYTGQRRIFNILERAVRKFHGDLGLWMQYIEFARSQKANKKLGKLLTEVLRMHPAKAEVWIYAARYAVDVQADVQAARGYLQRGLRFNQRSRAMYLEYARLEMGYVAKISARRRILGLEPGKEIQKKVESTSLGEEADMIALPSLTPEDLARETGEGDDEMSLNAPKNDPTLTPALSGAIPLAIFDAAMKQFDSASDLAEQFFAMFAVFTNVSVQPRILQHVIDNMLTISPTSSCTSSCVCRRPTIGVPINDPSFPAALGKALKEIRAALAESSEKPVLARKVAEWLQPISEQEDLAPELKQVISATLKQLENESKAQSVFG